MKKLNPNNQKYSKLYGPGLLVAYMFIRNLGVELPQFDLILTAVDVVGPFLAAGWVWYASNKAGEPQPEEIDKPV